MPELVPQKGPNLIAVTPRLAVKVSRKGDLASSASAAKQTDFWEFPAWAVLAGSGFLVLETNAETNNGINAEPNAIMAIPQGTGCSLTGAGFQFDAEIVATPASATVQNAVTIKLSSPAQGPALDALIGSQRKVHHIEICENRDVESSDRDQGLREYSFMPCALPELAWDDLDTKTKFLGREFEAPILITGMTGGVERGSHINHNLARAAAAAGIPMGVGSQRIALDDERFAGIFNVKKEVPGVFLIGNIGAAQLVGSRSREKAREICLRAIDMISADAMAIHVNVLQEMIQTEGDRDFRGVLDCIAFIARDFPVPLMIKEVGAGMDPRTATRLASRLGTAVHAIDVGGRGGTSWGWIEGLRATDPMTFELAKGFRDWGLTTGMALTTARQAIPMETQCQLVATGGIRSGVDVAKVVALGATMAGVGLPLFRAALKDTNEVDAVLGNFIKGLKTVMICTGARQLSDLAGAVIKTGPSHNPTRGTLP